MDVSILIALLSAVVALLAAYYARRSSKAAEHQAIIAQKAVEQAKAQNRIAIHNDELRIYKAFLAFRGKITAHGVNFKDESLIEWYESVRLAEFYFSKDTTVALTSLYEKASDISNLRGIWDAEGKRQVDLVKRTHDLCNEWREEANVLESKIRTELRIGEVES